MIPSMSPEPEQSQLRDYLLGRASQDAAARLDERLFESDVLVAELSNERQSLVEDFLSARLAAEELKLFQLQLSKSPELQREVADLRLLLSALERDADVSASRDRPALPRFFVVLSTALALLLCVVSLLYVQQRHRSAELESQLRWGRKAIEPAAPMLPPERSMVTAFLSADVFRGASGPPEVTIPTNASILELQVALHSLSADAAWNVELLSGEEILVQSTHTHVRQLGQEMFLPVLVNTRDLKAGVYAVRYAPASNPSAPQTRFFVIRQGR